MDGRSGRGGFAAALSPPVEVIAAYLHDPAGEMPPPYTSAVVSEADVRDIHAYLASIPAPPKLADILLLRLSQRN